MKWTMNSIFHLVWEYFKLISGLLKKIKLLGLSDDGDVFLVAKLAGESIFSADGVDSVVKFVGRSRHTSVGIKSRQHSEKCVQYYWG